MEFARRGRPATATSTATVDDDGRRSPDPTLPQDAMLVIRNALLSQLEKDTLRRKIIMAEVDKIERAVALRSNTVNGEQSKLVSFSGEDFIPHGMHEDEFHDLKDGRQGSTELEPVTPAMEDSFCGRSCWSDGKEGTEIAAYGEQSLQGSNESMEGEKASSSEKWKLTGITMPVKKPKPPQKQNHSISQVETPIQSHLQEHFEGKKHQPNVATFKSEATTKPSFSANQKTYSVKWTCSTCQVETPSERHLQEHFTGKKHRANESTLESGGNAISRKAETKTKLSSDENQKTYCSTCQVQTPSERHLQEHLIGKKHRVYVSTLESRSSAISQRAETKTKPSFDGNQKTYCSTCQVRTPSERHLQEHFIRKKHRANISTLEFRSNSRKAETEIKLSSDENQKTYSVKWSCSTFQVETPSKRHLQEHFAGKKHRLYVSTLESRENAINWKEETRTKPSSDNNQETYSVKWSCNACQVETPSERHLQEHLSGKKHQSYVSNLEAREISQKLETTIQPSSGANHKTSILKWSCSICQVETPSERHLQEHCAGKKHRSNIGMAKNIKSHEAKWQKYNVPQHPEVPPPIRSCSICQDNCSCESELLSQLLEKVRAAREQSKIIERNFGLLKSNLHSSIVSQVHEANSRSNHSVHQAHYDCKFDLDKNVGTKNHQLNAQALHKKPNDEEYIPPKIAKKQQPPLDCDVSNYQGKCNSERAEHHSLQKAEHAGGLCAADLGGGNTLGSNQFSRVAAFSAILSVMSLLYFLGSSL